MTVENEEYTSENSDSKYSPLSAQIADQVAQVTLWTVLHNDASRCKASNYFFQRYHTGVCKLSKDLGLCMEECNLGRTCA